MKLNSRLPVAICAIAGSALAVSACQSDGSGSPASSSAPASSAPASSASPAPASSAPASPVPASSAPASPVPASSAPAAGSSGASGPVVYDCTNPSARPGTRPSSITLSCGDGSDGLQDLTWSAWGSATATATGDFYENTCVPNCAEGKNEDYQVKVTLSKVKVVSGTSYFTQASLRWLDGKPPTDTQTVYGLLTPQS